MPPSAPTPSPQPQVSTTGTPRVVTQNSKQRGTTAISAQRNGWTNNSNDDAVAVATHPLHGSAMTYNGSNGISDSDYQQQSLSLQEVTGGGQDTGNNGIMTTQANNSTNFNDWMGGGGLSSSPWNNGPQLGNYSNSLYNSSLLGGTAAGLLGGGYYNSPLMGMGMMTGTTGPLATLTQAVYGVQQLILAVTQATQLCAAHAVAIHQATTWLQSTCRDALRAHRVMHQQAWRSYRDALDTANRDCESNPQQVQRQRRLRALRWMTVTVVTYVGWTVVRRLVTLLFGQHRRPPPRLTGMPPPPQPQYNASAAMTYPPYAQPPLYSAPAAGQYHYPYNPSPEPSSFYSLPPSHSYPTTYPY
jgi:hypothetical protein